jgi:hypothetical protein
VARSGGRKKEDSESSELLRDLEALLDDLGVRITHDRRVDGPGGYCLVNGEPRMILNSRLPASDQAEVILEELERLDLSGVYLSPALRARIEGTGDGEPEEPGS